MAIRKDIVGWDLAAPNGECVGLPVSEYNALKAKADLIDEMADALYALNYDNIIARDTYIGSHLNRIIETVLAKANKGSKNEQN